MIFSTLNQFNCFLLFLFFGIFLGFIYCIFSILLLKKYQKIFQKIIFEGIFYTFFSIFYVFLINFYNFGKISYVLIFAFLCGYCWAKKLLKDLVVFFENKWYNYIKKKKEIYNGRKAARKAKQKK